MAPNNLHPVSPLVLALDYSLTNQSPRSYPSRFTSSQLTPVIHPALTAPRFNYTPEQRSRAYQFRAMQVPIRPPRE